MERGADRAARFAKLALDAGVVDPQVRVSEQQGVMLAKVIEATFSYLELLRRNRRAAVSWWPVTFGRCRREHKADQAIPMVARGLSHGLPASGLRSLSTWASIEASGHPNDRPIFTASALRQRCAAEPWSTRVQCTCGRTEPGPPFDGSSRLFTDGSPPSSGAVTTNRLRVAELPLLAGAPAERLYPALRDPL